MSIPLFFFSFLFIFISSIFFFFFFNDTATTEIYTLSLHDALPIYGPRGACADRRRARPPRTRRGRGQLPLPVPPAGPAGLRRLDRLRIPPRARRGGARHQRGAGVDEGVAVAVASAEAARHPPGTGGWGGRVAGLRIRRPRSGIFRSEERRVGEEGRTPWWPD